MTTDINTLIDFFKKYTPNTDIKGEVEEQDDTSATTSTGGSAGYPAVTKWNSGVTRGPANQVGNTKWKDSVTINRGKANTLL
jgi:ABC-type glycerol-3-phosphate transport system substrate-binding protein